MTKPEIHYGSNADIARLRALLSKKGLDHYRDGLHVETYSLRTSIGVLDIKISPAAGLGKRVEVTEDGITLEEVLKIKFFEKRRTPMNMGA